MIFIISIPTSRWPDLIMWGWYYSPGCPLIFYIPLRFNWLSLATFGGCQDCHFAVAKNTTTTEMVMSSNKNCKTWKQKMYVTNIWSGLIFECVGIRIYNVDATSLNIWCQWPWQLLLHHPLHITSLSLVTWSLARLLIGQLYKCHVFPQLASLSPLGATPTSLLSAWHHARRLIGHEGSLQASDWLSRLSHWGRQHNTSGPDFSNTIYILDRSPWLELDVKHENMRSQTNNQEKYYILTEMMIISSANIFKTFGEILLNWTIVSSSTPTKP